MPRRQPFTALCQQVAALGKPRRADLHVHTVASDGEYTPSQVVHLAREAKLAAVAITDHDTFAGLPEATAAADGRIDVIPGVEITAEFDGREVHLLGYFARTYHSELNAALARICLSRRQRFEEYAAQLALPADRVKLVADSTPSLGRRHVARLLIACNLAKTTDDAFRRRLNPLRGTVPPKVRLPLEEAIALVYAAGGRTSLAHPPEAFDEAAFLRMKQMGLDALEAEYAWRRSAPAIRLRGIAAKLGLLVTGGSDCHGPKPEHRRIGSVSVKLDAVQALREK
ncbi:MAG: PHP domain-containing protein [Gemmataceae bacterium]